MTQKAGGLPFVIVALGTGCLPTLLLSFNSQLAAHSGAFVGSWIVHGTGTLAALVLLLLFWRLPAAERAGPRAARRLGPFSAAAPAPSTSC